MEGEDREGAKRRTKADEEEEKPDNKMKKHEVEPVEEKKGEPLEFEDEYEDEYGTATPSEAE